MLASAAQKTALVNFFRTGTPVRFGKGDFLVHPGETPPGVFYIEEGLVKSYDITKYGDENLLIIRKKGEFVGITWAITGLDRHIIYSALAPTQGRLVERHALLKFLQSSPEAALPLVDILTDVYRQHSERIMSLEYRSVRERLIAFLLNAAQRFGRKCENGVLIDVPLKHQDIASSISATRETTGRELAVLERQKLLRNEQSLIILYDLKKLRSFL